MWIHILAIVLCFGFSTVAVIGIMILDKQQEIQVKSRYGHKNNTLEIIYVNVALLLCAYLLYIQYYLFIPALAAFIVVVIITTRLTSGIGETGIFIGMTYLEWNKIKNYGIINDDINTLQIRIHANERRYILRCDKENKKMIIKLFEDHQILQKQPGRKEGNKQNETFN